ncbi:MAG: dethiobiotin synthase [Pseudomonadota bacterium]|jgi:dethiobiotin synthetase
MGMITPLMAEWVDAAGLLQGNGMFITGTDTGVGKTWVSVRLIHALRALGLELIPRKPVESGWSEDVTDTDAWRLANAAGLTVDDQSQAAVLDKVCPYRFRAALSPPRAASLEGRELRIANLAGACPTKVLEGQAMLVEGAGGFYSPIAQDGLNADLAQVLGLPVILVAEDRVGCINHILLVAEAIKRRSLTLAGVILNPKSPPVDGMDNVSDLLQWLKIPILRLI